MKLKILICISSLAVCLCCLARPARQGEVIMRQPDGSTFSAIIKGDEFIRIKTTLDGYSIMQDEDGWWCYAVYDTEGCRQNSGWKVGQDTPAEILSQSRTIPWERLAAKAAERRMTRSGSDAVPLMQRIRSAKGDRTKSSGAPVTKHGLVLLVQFKDVKFKHTRSDFVNLLTKEGYNVNGATGCAKEYFNAQFNGMYEFDFDVSEILTVSSDLAYYGRNVDDSDKTPETMVEEACRLADADILFSKYDDDGDGEVDNVFIFFAGNDEADTGIEDCIWSHAWYLKDGAGRNLTLDGMVINRYACTAEMARIAKNVDRLAGIGTFCHEYSHTFGLPDLYDTDYDKSGGTAEALWYFLSLMDSGNTNNNGNTPPYFTAIERELLGISAPVTISSDGTYTLTPIHKEGLYYRIDTDREGEYYLLECRANEGWDSYIGGKGMLIYHIDRSTGNAGYSDTYGKELTATERWMLYNEVNCRPDHQCADLIEASYSSLANVFFPYGKVTFLNAQSSPGLQYWSGSNHSVAITGITRNDSGNVTFNVTNSSETPVSIKTNTFQTSALITFESSSGSFNGNAIVTWGKTDEDITGSRTISPYDTGKYALMIENLDPGSNYTVTLSFEIGGVPGQAKTRNILTRRLQTDGYPYIYLGSATDRNEDGTFSSQAKFPLIVFNATDAAEVVWTFNGKEIQAGKDFHFTTSERGMLQARVIWKDGTEDIIRKGIMIR